MSAWGNAWGSAWGDAWGGVGAAQEPDYFIGGPDASARADFDDDELFMIGVALITSGILETA